MSEICILTFCLAWRCKYDTVRKENLESFYIHVRVDQYLYQILATASHFTYKKDLNTFNQTTLQTTLHFNQLGN